MTEEQNEQPTPASDPAPASAPDTPEATKPQPELETPPAPAVPAASAAPRPRTPQKGNWWWGTGRRKAAVARVRIQPGDGTFMVNTKPYEDFFTRERDRKDLLEVLEKTNTRGKVNIHVNVRGGGVTGQTGAIVLGLGRALKRYDQTLEPILRDNGFLTRDPRKVERKKYGQAGARRRFQFSKR